jgi:hypothetical protein
MDKQTGVPEGNAFESCEFELAWRALARIIARRHIRNQLNKDKGNNDENITNHDSNNKTSKG